MFQSWIDCNKLQRRLQIQKQIQLTALSISQIECQIWDEIWIYLMQQNYLMNFRESHSSLQKNFQTQTTFKRNTRYYNVPEIINLENQDCIKRRRPLPNHDELTERKIDQSFTNSTTALSNRLCHEITKFSRRVSGQFSPPKSEYEKQYSSPSSPKLRSFSIDRMLSRQHIDAIKVKPILDERMFNNFKIQKHDLSRTCDFSKLKGRNLDYNLKHINDLYHQSKKGHDYCFYKDTTLKAKVSYKFQNKEKKRYFFIRKRATDFPATVLNPEKVDNGLKIASNFKGSNITSDKISPFYMSTGKQLPSQYDMRYMTHLTNFYKNQKDELVQPKVDYTVKKLKQDLIMKRKEAAKQSKSPNFTRDEVCDAKYFKQQIEKQRKAKLKNKNNQTFQ